MLNMSAGAYFSQNGSYHDLSIRDGHSHGTMHSTVRGSMYDYEPFSRHTLDSHAYNLHPSTSWHDSQGIAQSPKSVVIAEEQILQEQLDKLHDIDARIEDLERAIQEEDVVEERDPDIIHRIYSPQESTDERQLSGSRIFSASSQYGTNQSPGSDMDSSSYRYAGGRNYAKASLPLTHHDDSIYESKFNNSNYCYRNGSAGNPKTGSQHYKYDNDSTDESMHLEDLHASQYMESGTQTSPKKNGSNNSSYNSSSAVLTQSCNEYPNPMSLSIPNSKLHSAEKFSRQSSKNGHVTGTVYSQGKTLETSHRRQSNVGLEFLQNDDPVQLHNSNGKFNSSKCLPETNSQKGPMTLVEMRDSASYGYQSKAYGSLATSRMDRDPLGTSYQRKSMEDRLWKMTYPADVSGGFPHEVTNFKNMLGSGSSNYLLQSDLGLRASRFDNRLFEKSGDFQETRNQVANQESLKSYASGNILGDARNGSPSDLLMSAHTGTVLPESPPPFPRLPQHRRSTRRRRKRSVDSVVGQVDLDSSVMTFASFRSVDMDESVMFEEDQWTGQFENSGQFGTNSFSGVQHSTLRLSSPLNGHYNQDMSATLWPFKLLELLHHSNPDQCQELILKARVFRKWYYQTQVARRGKARNDKLEHRAICHHQQTIMFNFWRVWKTKATNGQKLTNAQRMYNRHLLTKGLQGLKWAAEQAKTLTSRVQTISRATCLRIVFSMWKKKTEGRHYNLMFNIFRRWQHFKLQSERKRMLKTLASQHLMTKWFCSWKERYHDNQKSDIAVLHHKVFVLTQCWRAWRLYTSQSIVGEKEKEVALVHYEHIIQRRALLRMKEMYIKYQCAKIHWRRHELRSLFKRWQQETSMLKLQHMREIQRSNVQYNAACVRSAFRKWKMQSEVRRLVRLKNERTCSRAFEIWSLRWRKKMLRRAMDEAKEERQMKYRAFITWLQTTRLMKEGRHNAIILLQRALLRGIVHDWKIFTQYKIHLSIKLQEHNVVTAQQSKKYFFHEWVKQLKRKLTLQEANKLWSLKCVKQAIISWKEAVHLKKLETLFESHQPRARYFIVYGAWKTWLLAKHRSDWDREKSEGFQRASECRQTRQIFFEWRLQAQQSLITAPLRNKTHRRHIGRAFDAWRLVYLRKQQSLKRCQQHHQNQLRRVFTLWRSKASKNMGLLQLKKRTNHRALQNCLGGWRMVLNRRKLCILFQQKSEANFMVYTLSCWRERLHNLQCWREQMLEEEEHAQSVKKTVFDSWLENVLSEKVEEDVKINQFSDRASRQLLSHVFYSWKTTVDLTEKGRQLTEQLNKQRLRHLFTAWQTLVTDEMYGSIQRFHENMHARSPSHGGEFLSSLSLPPSPVPCSARSMRSGPLLSARELSFHPDTFAEMRDDDDIFIFSSHSTPRSRLMRHESENTARTSLCSVEIDSFNSSGNFHALQTPLTTLKIPDNDFQTLATYAINRWRCWPISVAFYQWREFTIRQQNMRAAKEYVEETAKLVCESLALKHWWIQYRNEQTARVHLQSSLMRKCISAWLEYIRQEKQSREASRLAQAFYLAKVQREALSVWRQKIAMKHKLEELHGIWYDLPPEQGYLRGYCESFQEGIATTTLQNCWKMWRIKFAQMKEVNQYKDLKILRRYFKAWIDYSRKRAESKEISVDFQNSCLRRQFFELWKRRLHQKQEVERKFVLSWRQYAVDILQRWHTWAANHRSQTEALEYISQSQAQSAMTEAFCAWKHELYAHRLAKQFSASRLVSRAFVGWRDVSKRQRELDQLHSLWTKRRNSSLVTTAFQLWQVNARLRQLTRESRQCIVDGYVRKAAQKWLTITLLNRALRRRAYRTQVKVFKMWKSHVEQQQRAKGHALFYGLLWKKNVLNCRRREMEAEDLCRQFNDRTLRSHFDMWVNSCHKLKQGRKHHDLKLQQRALSQWLMLTQRKRLLKEVQSNILLKENSELLSNTFHIWKTEFMLASSQQHKVNIHLEKKHVDLLRQVLGQWYVWSMEQKADRHHSYVMTRKVMRAWHDRVLTSQQHTATMLALQSRFESRLVGRAFALWQNHLVLQSHVNTLAERKLIQQTFKNWIAGCERQKSLRDLKKTVTLKVDIHNMAHFFTFWKNRFNKHLQREEEVRNMIGRCNFKLVQVTFHLWRDSTRENMAISIHAKNTLRATFKKWRTAQSLRQLDCSLTEMADSHHGNRMSLLVLRAWRAEVLVTQMAKKRLERIVRQCATRWLSVVRNTKLAIGLFEYNIQCRAWRVWSERMIKRQVSKNVENHLNKIAMAEVFRAWHHVTMTKKNGSHKLQEHNLTLMRTYYNQWKLQT